MTSRNWIAAILLAGAVGGVALDAQRGAQAPAAPAEAAARPALLFKEEWKQPPYTGQLNDENRRVTPAALTNANLELKLYGAQVKEVGVYNHEGRFDLWSGMSNSPVGILLRDKTSTLDLTGLARVRAIVRTSNLHVLHPVVKLADGTLAAGSQRIDTNGEFLSVEVAFGNQRWYKLDPAKLTTTTEVKTPDLSKIDEVGFVDLMPSGGHGSAGWANISTFEVYAKAARR